MTSKSSKKPSKNKKKEKIKKKSIIIPDIFFFTISIIWLFIITKNFFKYHHINLKLSYLFSLEGNFVVSQFLKLILSYTISSILATGIILGAYYIGKKIITFTKLQTSSFLELLNFSIGLGMGSTAIIIYLIGIIGFLYKIPIYILWITFASLGIKELLADFKNNTSTIQDKIPLPYKIILSLLFLIMLFNFLLSLTPEIFYDSLVYHLGAPNYFKINHKILPMPYTHPASFPLNMSMLYLYGIILKGGVVAKLINFSTGILIMLSIFYFCAKYLKNISAGIVSAITFYSIPIVIHKSWVTNSDIGLIYFTTLSLFCLINFLYNTEEKNKSIWFIFSAIFAGFMLGTKYTGFFFLFGLFPVLLITSKNIKKILLWGAITLIVFSPWLLRNYFSSGNPFYPFLSKFFKTRYPFKMSYQSSSQERSLAFSDSGKEFFDNPFSGKIKIKHLGKFIQSFWDISIKGGGDKAYASVDYYMIGAVFLAFIPLFFFIVKSDKRFFYLLFLFSALSYIPWVLFAKSLRYIAPVFPALSIIAGYVIVKIDSMNKYIGKIILTFFFLLVLRNFLFVLPIAYNTYHPFSVITGAINKDKFLSSSRPSYPYPSYTAYKYINKNLDKNAKILIFGDAKSFYINRNFIKGAAKSLTPLIELLKGCQNEDEFYTKLKNKKITHILVNVPEALRTAGYNTLYFKKREILILDKFWKKYVKKIFETDGLYLYEILTGERNNQSYSVPSNVIKNIFIDYNLRKAYSFIKNKKISEAQKILQKILDIDYNNDQIHYLLSISYYYSGNKKMAIKEIEEAYKLNPEEKYKKMLKELKRL